MCPDLLRFTLYGGVFVKVLWFIKDLFYRNVVWM